MESRMPSDCCVQAMVKPREHGDFDGWHRTPVERVAYLLNLLLGLDYVPPTVYRQDLEVEGRKYPNGAALIYFVDDMKLLEEVEEHDWGVGKEGMLSDTRILVRYHSLLKKPVRCPRICVQGAAISLAQLC